MTLKLQYSSANRHPVIPVIGPAPTGVFRPLPLRVPRPGAPPKGRAVGEDRVRRPEARRNVIRRIVRPPLACRVFRRKRVFPPTRLRGHGDHFLHRVYGITLGTGN